MPGNTPYCLSKGGMRMLTRTAGVELGPQGVRVVGVGPGAVATPINKSTMDDPAKMKVLDAAIPLARMAEPAEIGNVVAFLASRRCVLPHRDDRLRRRRDHAQQPRALATNRGRLWPSATTSSSSAPARAAARSRTRWRRPASRSSSSSAATSSRARWRTGRPAPVFIDGRYISDETWYDADGKAFQPQVHYFVGGATKLYGAALYRLRPQDFGELKHVDGISPAWPVSYDDFEPYYTKAEWLYQVRGNHGEDPTEGPWSKQYPWPAVSHEPRIQQLSDDLEQRGLPPVPRAVRHPVRRSRPAEEHVHPVHLVRRLPVPRARQVRRRDDRGASDPRRAERDAARRRRRSPKLETDASGRDGHRRRRRRAAASARVVRGRRRRRSPRARRTAPSSCCASANDRHPNGLANGSDQVGRNYMFHNSKAVVALSKERNDTVVPEDARPERLLPRRRRLPVPDRQHPDGRQVERRGDEGRRAASSRSSRRTGASTTSRTTPSTSGSPPKTSRSRTTA